MDEESMNHFAPPFRCLFCLSKNGPFLRIEHPIPESMGNDDLIIEPGFICDPCNNYFGAKVEQKVMNRPPFSIDRVRSSVKTKKGKYSKFESPSFSLYGTEYHNRPIIIAQQRAVDPADPQVLINGNKGIILIPSHSTDDQNILRMLLKMGLELLLLATEEDPYANQYDQARKAARFSPKGMLWEMSHMYYPRSEDLVISERYDEIGPLVTSQLYSYQMGFMKDGALGFSFMYTNHLFTVNLNTPSIESYVMEFNRINEFKMNKIVVKL